MRSKPRPNPESYFDGRVVIMDSSRKARYSNFNMDVANLRGSASVTVTATDVEIYFLVVAMPEDFKGNRVYDYTYTIERTDPNPTASPTTTGNQFFMSPSSIPKPTTANPIGS